MNSAGFTMLFTIYWRLEWTHWSVRAQRSVPWTPNCLVCSSCCTQLEIFQDSPLECYWFDPSCLIAICPTKTHYVLQLMYRNLFQLINLALLVSSHSLATQLLHTTFCLYVKKRSSYPLNCWATMRMVILAFQNQKRLSKKLHRVAFLLVAWRDAMFLVGFLRKTFLFSGSKSHCPPGSWFSSVLQDHTGWFQHSTTSHTFRTYKVMQIITAR